jgi:RsiW-degrading membrane proteinase PrsW (M82 family)
MIIEIANYKDSFLSLLLKMVTPILFAIGTYYFYQARQVYGGEIQRIVNLLFAGGIAGFLATAFRYGGDSIISWKWGESAFMLIFALTSVYVAFLVKNRLIVAARALGIIEED